MNLYIRYFDEEALCHNMQEMREFLESQNDITVTEKMIDDISAYAENGTLFPKRYKVTARNYFIMIKTEFDSLAEFHAHGKDTENGGKSGKSASKYQVERVGWYQCEKLFRRVVPTEPNSKKFDNVESSIEMLVYASTPAECHSKIVEYLKTRPDLDRRCQFPALKESNFTFQYKGETLD